MMIPDAKAQLLDQIIATLAEVPGLEAVALGGSHARGTHLAGSDLDIGLYYRDGAPFAVEHIATVAQRFSTGGKPVVTGFYEWGPFVNGGAWIDNPVCKIDLLYRNLDQLETIVAQAQKGKWEHSYDQQPPFGFRTVTILGEIQCCKPLRDPGKILEKLKETVAVFPAALKAQIIQDCLWGAEFSLRFAYGFAEGEDVPNTVACMTRIFHYLVQALFALNDIYFVNDKRASIGIDAFARKPAEFGARIGAILAKPGADAAELGISLGALDALFREVAALAGNAYRPKFPLP